MTTVHICFQLIQNAYSQKTKQKINKKYFFRNYAKKGFFFGDSNFEEKILKSVKEKNKQKKTLDIFRNGSFLKSQILKENKPCFD